MDNPQAFKHHISAATVQELAARLSSALPDFDGEAFARLAQSELDDLELKARLKHIARAARLTWTGPVGTLIAALPVACDAAHDPAGRGAALSGWPVWALLQIVEDHGLPARDESLAAMHALTPLWSAEFAIRPFLRADPERTLRVLHTWAQDPNEHVRRLASEGSRPRLPWGGRLRRFDDDPAHTLPVLERLRSDPALYVRRSVANHLNDLAKRHPDRVVEVLTRWQREIPCDETTWLTRHATRTLIKQGHRGALALRGFAPPALSVDAFTVSPAVLELGDALQLHAALTAHAPAAAAGDAQRWAVDFVVHHVKADGSRSPKVFKWREVRAAPGAVVRLDKSHRIRPITTRRYYPGEHVVELQVNGRVFARQRFVLKT